MLKRSILIFIAAVLTVALFARVLFAADSTSPWNSSGDPSLTALSSLPDNILPATSNTDCQNMTTRYAGTNTMQEVCAIEMPLGLIADQGIVFAGTSEAIAVVPPPHFFSLGAISGQPMVYTYSSSPVYGLYMHFYRNIYSALSSKPEMVNGRLQYTLTKNPDFGLSDSAGKLRPMNPKALAFSANGSWMVVDLPYQGLVRYNTATFEMLPFGPSIESRNDFSTQKAHLAVSNDGRYVTVKQDRYASMHVYDLSTCQNAVLPVDPLSPKCQSRDYSQYLQSRIPNLRFVLRPRFINQNQLSFIAVYDVLSASSMKSKNYVMTAPGQNPTGMTYLGMGDSFASGQGAFNYVAGTDTDNNTCHQSSLSYPHLLSGTLFAGGKSVACSGAVTDDISELSNNYEGQVADQIPKLRRSISDIQQYLSSFTPGYLAQSEFVDTYRPEVISLSVGGNDIGFSDIIKRCVSPVTTEPSCYSTFEDQVELYRAINNTFDSLVRTYKTVHRPGKRVYIVGYPQIALPGGNCAANVHLDAREIELSVNIIDHLNGVIAAAARKAGVYYVDVSQALAGHRMCENVSREVAVNGFTIGSDEGIGSVRFIGSESYHPNAFGHTLLERSLRATTDNLTSPMPPADPAAVPPQIPETHLGSLLPRAGREILRTVPAGRITDDVLVIGQSHPLKITNTTALLKPATTYRVELHSTPLSLESATTSLDGRITSNLTIPAGTPAGFHTLHIFGPNMLGQSIDIYKTVYVAASAEDYDGNGRMNNDDACLVLPASGIDYDRDGVDDACDPLITEPSEDAGRSFTVSLTGNSLRLTR